MSAVTQDRSAEVATAGVPPNRTIAAAGAILAYATIIAFTDNFVIVIAEEGGLWQFQATRTLMACVLVALACIPFGLVLRPRNLRAVAARSVIHGTGMMIYFGCLAFLSVAEAAAGLFTAPIFVLLISRFVYGHALGPARIVAVAIGFAGVVLVLMPSAEGGLSMATVLPVAAGACYALGNVATREWCAGESAATLTLGFFLALGLGGLVGLGLLAVFPLPVPEGAAGFVLRGWVWPSAGFLWWTFVQALGSFVAVGLMVRAYQLAEASRVSIFEYVILPASAAWSWVIWGQTITWGAVAGMVLIFAAGFMIAARGR